MTKQDLIREKLDKKVFQVLGKVVTFKKKSSPTYNTRGEEEGVTYTTSSVTIVPYNIVAGREVFNSFGNFQEGDMAAAVPYTVTVDIGDVFTIESVDWIVKQVEKNYLPDNVVTIVLLSKAH